MDRPDFSSILNQHAPRLNALGVDDAQKGSLLHYLEQIWEHNQERNLVSRKITPEELVSAHLLDSLIALPHFPKKGTIADLGSGGGLPAIPLAICRPEVSFRLFEKSPVKCAFLETAAGDLENVAICGKVEPFSLNEEIDLAMARAFRPLDAALNATLEYYKNGGAYLFFKARREKIEEELRAAKVPAKRTRIIRLEPPPGIDERHLLFIGASPGN
jgi:16S rRNA (guanine527-N7)-methyltransferase